MLSTTTCGFQVPAAATLAEEEDDEPFAGPAPAALGPERARAPDAVEDADALLPDAEAGSKFHTKALRSCEQVTIWFVDAHQSTPLITKSCCERKRKKRGSE